MKRFHLIFPKSECVKWVEYAHANGITNALSWYEVNDMFSFSNSPTGINVIGIASEEQTNALLASDWKKFIQK